MIVIDAATVGQQVEKALHAANLSQRKLAALTGVAQSRISRFIDGSVLPQAPELLMIARETGVPLGVLAGTNDVASRAKHAARATGSTDMTKMREMAEMYLELNDYLHMQRLR